MNKKTLIEVIKFVILLTLLVLSAVYIIWLNDQVKFPEII